MNENVSPTPNRDFPCASRSIYHINGSLWLSWQIIHKPGFPLLFANPFTDCWILPDVAFFLENLVINSTSTLRIFSFLCFRSFCDPILNGISRIFVVFFGLSRVTQIRAIKLDWSLTNALFGLVIYRTDHCWGRIHGDLAVGSWFTVFSVDQKHTSMVCNDIIQVIHPHKNTGRSDTVVETMKNPKSQGVENHHRDRMVLSC